MDNSPLNQDEIVVLRSTWAMLKPIPHVLTNLFYSRLFEEHPSMRALFSRDLYVQRAKLMATLDYLIAALDQPEKFRATAARLGVAHRSYGVQDEDYVRVEQALRWALARSLGPGYTPEVETAWKKLYMLVAAHMRAEPIGANRP